MARAETTTDQPLDATRSFAAQSVHLDTSPTSSVSGEPEDAAPGGDVPELRDERFQIGAKLGEGGMGLVYRARDTRDGARSRSSS